MADVKERIVELLRARPRGLTLKEISEALDVSRPTAAKYVFELKGAGRLVRRRVGSGILHYLVEPSVALSMSAGGKAGGKQTDEKE
jgi:DNA-binding Lrp family transcriptional regulator